MKGTQCLKQSNYYLLTSFQQALIIILLVVVTTLSDNTARPNLKKTGKESITNLQVNNYNTILDSARIHL